MNSIKIEKSISSFLPVGLHRYKGQQDECGCRHGHGDQEWKSGPVVQKYSGKFLHDSLHKKGTYTSTNLDTRSRLTYEGRFYANELEGYGCFSYPDGTRFEGLFQGSKRFGPGILTHADGTQDVGIWIGNNLVRLNQTVEKPVPEIAQTVFGKSYLLNYKRLVSVQQKKPEVADQILEEIDSGENTITERKYKLYSKLSRNKKSAFFNKKKFDEIFEKEKEFTIDVVESDVTDTNVAIVSTKKVLVTHLIAWNNEDVAINIMRHAFKYRNQEFALSYNVANVLTGMRKDFKQPGSVEMRSLRFLETCCEDDASLIIYLICEFDTYPNIQDYQGNNSVTYAAVHDNYEVIRALTDLGGNVDNMNDECLTPLILCILRYIAIKFNVISWELAFLPRECKTELNPQIQDWRSCIFYDRETLQDLQNYLFDLTCRKPTKEKHAKGGKSKKKNKVKEIEDWIDLDADKLHKIENTILCLLDCGAKPDYGDCPFPPLILSVFSKSRDIVLQLLQHKADPNIRTIQHLGNLTALHVLVSLHPHAEMVDIAEVLITNNADTELRTNLEHWDKETKIIKAGTQPEDLGKTALHVLCMRYDFNNDSKEYLTQLCEVFLNLGAQANSLYLGHVPLTLAMLRGNVKLIKTLLNSGLIDPNQNLDNNMGVPLTVLILKRYERILSTSVCENVYNTLLEYYANPLCEVYGSGNAVEFCIQEYKPPEKGSISAKKSKKGAKPKPKSAKPKKGKKENAVIKVLYKAAETTLLKHVYRKAVQYLYTYKIESHFTSSLFPNIVKYLTIENTLKYLQILLDNDLIVPSKTFCYQLLQYVQSSNKQKGKKDVPLYDLVDSLNFEKSETLGKFFTFDIPMPDIDPDESKFKVCFECFQKTNKVLVLCPKCNLIYFCSQQCNIKNNKNKNTKHPCKVLFYNTELELMLQRIELGLPADLNIFNKFNTMRQERIAKNPDYFSTIQEEDKEMSQKRDEERAKIKTPRSRSKSKERKGGSKDRKGGSRERKGGSRERKGSTDRKGRSRDRKGGSKERKESKERKGGSRERKGGSKERRGSRERKGGSKERKGGSRERKESKERKGGSRERKGKTEKVKKGKDKSDIKVGTSGKENVYLKDGKPVRNAKVGPGKELVLKDTTGKGDGPSTQVQEKPDRRVSDCVYPVGDARLDQTGVVTEHLQRSISNLCEPFNLKFFLMFMPYCAFVNGELYYKFDNASPFQKLINYSCN